MQQSLGAMISRQVVKPNTGLVCGPVSLEQSLRMGMCDQVRSSCGALHRISVVALQ